MVDQFILHTYEDGSANPTLTVTTAGTYSVTRTDASNSVSDSMVIDILNVDITQNDTTG